MNPLLGLKTFRDFLFRDRKGNPSSMRVVAVAWPLVLFPAWLIGAIWIDLWARLLERHLPSVLLFLTSIAASKAAQVFAERDPAEPTSTVTNNVNASAPITGVTAPPSVTAGPLSPPVMPSQTPPAGSEKEWLEGASLVGHGRSTQYELDDLDANYPRAFRDCLLFILNHETEWNRDGTVHTENDARDPGGVTKFGIDKRSHPLEDIGALTLPRAEKIYYDEWQHAGAPLMDPLTAFAFFDSGINCGFDRVRKWRQQATGQFDEDVASELCMKRQHYYEQEVRAALRAIYLKGWLARLKDLRVALGLA